MIRQLGLLTAKVEACGGDLTGRHVFIAYALDDEDFMACFGVDVPHAPEAFSDQDQKLIDELKTFDSDSLPEVAHYNLPAWILPKLEARFGDDWRREMTALNHQATLDIRVNPLKTNVDNIFGKMVGAGYRVSRTAFSPYGIRSDNPIQLSEEEPYREGLIEVQDEAAQLASVIVGAKNDEKVVDLCAGAGGKSLMIASLLKNRGFVQAYDISGRRLKEFTKRAERAGLTNVSITELPLHGKKRENILGHIKAANHVVLDVPCSGSGTWRRNPDQRWRLTQDSLNDLADTQLSLLTEGSKLVKKDGYVFYMTCSLFEEENEDIVDKFLAHNSNFERISAVFRLNDLLDDAPEVVSCSNNGLDLLLTPEVHNTDGFYVSVLHCKST